MTFKIGVVFVLGVVALAVLGPWLSPYDPAAQLLPLRLQGPTFAHPVGLDELGRDILARLIVGARISLLVGVAVVSVSATAGLIIGSVAGYAGGWIDALVGRVMDVLLAFPASCSRSRSSRSSVPASPTWSSLSSSAGGWATRASCADRR